MFGCFLVENNTNDALFQTTNQSPFYI